ncbi:MAG: SUMF1/EgtB/PvdO family nonheme iron enzyme, partial [Pseudomonadota bacterium]
MRRISSIAGVILALGACAGERPPRHEARCQSACDFHCTRTTTPPPSCAGSNGGAGADRDGGPNADHPGGDATGAADNLLPVPRIAFQTRSPTDEADYPYGPDVPAAIGPLPGSTVYLSARGSIDPEGQPVAFFWNVQDPTGAYLPIAPDATAARASFRAPVIGSYVITLEVIETGPPGQIGHTTLSLVVGPTPCAADGVSRPCSDKLAVPGGTFTAGAAVGAGKDNERPAHAVTVSPFLLDKYEVTVGRFRRYLDAYEGDAPAEGAGGHPLIPGSGWQPAWRVRLPTPREVFKL